MESDLEKQKKILERVTKAICFTDPMFQEKLLPNIIQLNNSGGYCRASYVYSIDKQVRMTFISSVQSLTLIAKYPRLQAMAAQLYPSILKDSMFSNIKTDKSISYCKYLFELNPPTQHEIAASMLTLMEYSELFGEHILAGVS